MLRREISLVKVLTVGGIAGLTVGIAVLTVGGEITVGVAMSIGVITVIGSQVEVRVASGILGVVRALVLRVVLVVVGWREVMLGIHVGVRVFGHILGGLVMDGTTVGLVLKLDMGLLLVVFIVIMTVGNVRLFVVHGMIVENAGLVVVMDVFIVVDTLVVNDLVVHGCLLVDS